MSLTFRFSNRELFEVVLSFHREGAELSAPEVESNLRSVSGLTRLFSSTFPRTHPAPVL